MRRTRTEWMAALVALAMAAMLGACGGDTPSSSTGTTAAPKAIVEPIACADLERRTTLNFDVDGSMRTALVVIPERVRAMSAPAPAGIVFHGYTGTPSQFDRDGKMTAAAERDGFVLVLPEGDGGVWYFPGLVAGGEELEQAELAFFDALHERISSLDCVDPERIVVGGGSMGGGMADFIACRRSDRIAGALLVVAEHFQPPCRPERPVPIVSVHALDDSILPYEGGSVTDSVLEVIPVMRAVKTWARHNGCTGGPRSERLPGGVTRMSWSGCDAPVVHYRLDKGDHGWFIKPLGLPVDSNELLVGLMRAERSP